MVKSPFRHMVIGSLVAIMAGTAIPVDANAEFGVNDRCNIIQVSKTVADEVVLPSPPAWMIRGLVAAAQDPETADELSSLPLFSWPIAELDGGNDATAIVSALTGQLDAMREPDATVRERAAEAIMLLPGRVWSEELIRRLVDQLDPDREKSEEVRATVVEVLGGANSEIWNDRLSNALIERLDPVLEPSSLVRWVAAEALGQTPDGMWNAGLVEALVKHLDPQWEADEPVRMAAAEALGRAPERMWSQGLVEALVKQLDPKLENDRESQCAAAYALLRTPDEMWSAGLVEALAMLLNPDDVVEDHLWLIALEAFRRAPEKIWTEPFVGMLLGCLDSSRPWDSNCATAAVLGRAPDRLWSADLVETLFRRLDPEREENEQVRVTAAVALQGVPEPLWSVDLVDALVNRMDALRETNGQVRLAVTVALQGTPDPLWNARLVDALVDRLSIEREENKKVRAAAAEAIGRAPNRLWTTYLVERLFILSQFPETQLSPNFAHIVLWDIKDEQWSEEIVNTFAKKLSSVQSYIFVEQSNYYFKEFTLSLPDSLWTEHLVETLFNMVLDNINQLHQNYFNDQRLVFAIRNLRHMPMELWKKEIVSKVTTKIGQETKYEKNKCSLNISPDIDTKAQYFDKVLEYTKSYIITVSANASLALQNLPYTLWSETMILALVNAAHNKNGSCETTRAAAAETLGKAPPEIQQTYASTLVRAYGGADIETLLPIAYVKDISDADLVPLLNRIQTTRADDVPRLRALAHVLSGGTANGATLVRWLGRPGELPLAGLRSNSGEAHRVLATIMAVQSDIDRYPSLADEARTMAGTIAVTPCQGADFGGADFQTVARDVVHWLFKRLVEGPLRRCWTDAQAPLLEQVAQWIEPPRVCRRLQLLRRWSHYDQDHEQVFPGSAPASRAAGAGSRT